MQEQIQGDNAKFLQKGRGIMHGSIMEMKKKLYDVAWILHLGATLNDDSHCGPQRRSKN